MKSSPPSVCTKPMEYTESLMLTDMCVDFYLYYYTRYPDGLN